MKDRGLERLRKRVRDRLRELLAHEWIVAPPDTEAVATVEQTKRNIRAADKKQLYEVEQHIVTEIERIRSAYKITATPTQLLMILDFMESSPPGHSALIPLYILRDLFEAGRYPMFGLDVWPIHARVALDASGLLYAKSRHPEISLLEALMFEDMAALFNAAKREHAAAPKRACSKPSAKLHNALCRGATTAAIHFMEAYVNGVAVDYFIEHEEQLDTVTKSVLLDWNFDRDQPKYLSLREKLLQYQRIVLGVAHAPLQETNCPEMGTVLRMAKSFRDAIAHPSPALHPKTMDADKERAIHNLTICETERVVDAAVHLVRRLEKTLHGDLKRLWWLHDRRSDGFFPDAAFE